jgi:hypothetical protein
LNRVRPNFSKARIFGEFAIRGFLYATTLENFQEFRAARKQLTRHVRIAARAANAFLEGGGTAPAPPTKEERDRLLKKLQAQVDASLSALPTPALPKLARVIRPTVENWERIRQRRAALHRAKRLGLDAALAVYYALSQTEPERFETNLRIVYSDAVLAARSAQAYLDSGGTPLPKPSIQEVRVLRVKLRMEVERGIVVSAGFRPRRRNVW